MATRRSLKLAALSDNSLLTALPVTPEALALDRRERWSTRLLGLLVALTSASGVRAPALYAGETASWRTEAHGQDIANLLGVPVLLTTGYLAARRSSRARQVWAGVLLFLVYAYAVYAFDLHYNRLFLAYVATLGLAGCTLLLNIARLGPARRVRPDWKGRLVGGFLVLVAVLFGSLWLSEEIPAAVNGVAPLSVAASGLFTNPIHALDLAFILPASLTVGFQVWRGRDWGQVWAVPLLVFFVLTGMGIVAAMVLAAGGFASIALFMSVVVVASGALAWLQLSRRVEGPVQLAARSAA